MSKSRVVSATEFKAKCLSLLDEVEQGGGQITVTKRGRPVATLGPVPQAPWKSPANSLAGLGKLADDIDSYDTSALWNVVTGK